MKINNKLKALPFLVTLLTIIVLNINNKKDNTELRILLWTTPSLSVGTYLSLSTGTGFILSYIITTGLVKLKESNSTQKIKYRKDSNEDNSYQQNISYKYEKTLIERDIKEPSPTINASFRVIGKIDRVNEQLINNQYTEDDNLVNSNISDDSDSQISASINNEKNFNAKLNDWDDENYDNW